MQKKMHIGGFAAFNAGTISDCYSAVRIRSRHPASGFCAENSGNIRNCLFRGVLRNNKRNKSGLVHHQNGSMTNSYWIRNNNGSKEKKYTDWDLSLCKSDVSKEIPSVINNSWNFNTTWAYKDGVFELFDNIVSPESSHTVVEISSREDLIRFSSAVNEGTTATGILYRLTKDIDLCGKEWIPIGADPQKPFRGIFDGAGHMVKNFHIKTSKYPYAGLFGCTAASASIINLTVDCILSGKGNCSGPLCAHNRGTIRNCIARSQCSFSRYVGGLVGQNEGTISNCCALGKILILLPFPWWAPLLLLLLLSAIICFSFYLSSAEPAQEMFAPIIIDPNAKPVEDTIPAPETHKIKESNATFIMNAEMFVSTSNYAGVIGLRCPSWSNRGFVTTIRVSGSDLADKGISASEDYYTIYQSGLIQPGYGIDIITLSGLPDGTKLPAGSYEFSVLFEFYNTETNEKHVINSTAPLNVTIR